ncbi:hypothetical protein EME01_38210 [Sinorhizobium meliloti]|nr:hypothetical protein EME01_38210 [Sinorhizobium meliloti]
METKAVLARWLKAPPLPRAADMSRAARKLRDAPVYSGSIHVDARLIRRLAVANSSRSEMW